MPRTAPLVLLALLAAGCARRAAPTPGDVEQTESGPTLDLSPGVGVARDPDAEAERVGDRSLEPPAPLPGAEAGRPLAVEFSGADDVVLHADFWRTGEPAAPAVVLVHQARSDRSEWRAFVADLRSRAPGIAVLAVDLRGHGASTRAGEVRLRWQDLRGGDRAGLRRWAACASDVQAAVAWLRGRGEGTMPRAIGLVGSSIGATAVLRTAATDGVAGPGRIAAVAVISPGAAIFSVPIRAAVETLRVRGLPVLAVGARDDTNGVAGTAQEMQEILGEHLRVQLYEDGGHGVGLAAVHPEAVTLVVDFLRRHLSG